MTYFAKPIVAVPFRSTRATRPTRRHARTTDRRTNRPGDSEKVFQRGAGTPRDGRTQLATSDICNRISVQPPYFALANLVRGSDGTVHADIHPEQPMEYELGEISAAEIGRHLAILGSCAAAASGDGERTYYLAKKARFRRILPVRATAECQMLKASAKITQLGRRDLTAEALIAHQAAFAQLTVHYQVMPESLFKRVFSQLRITPSKSSEVCTESPYRDLISLRYDKPTGLSLVAHSPGLSAHACAGHFAEYPAWPVALIMHALGNVAGRLFQHVNPTARHYSVIKALVSAEHLVAASDLVSFRATLNNAATSPPIYTFSCQAIRLGQVVAELETEFLAEEKQPASAMSESLTGRLWV